MTTQNTGTSTDPILNQPAVPLSYKPNGKLTFKGLSFMLLFSWLGATFGGIVMYYAGEFCTRFGSWFGLIGGLIGMLFYFVCIPYWCGFVIAFSIWGGSLFGKNRNLKAATCVGFSASLVMILVYSIFRVQKYNLDAFDAFPDFLKVALSLAFISTSSIAGARELICETPFCDKCENMMLCATTPTIPISKLPDMLSSGKARQFDVFLNDLYQGQSNLDHYLVANVYYCNKCRAHGYINLFAKQIITEANNTQNTTRTDSKRIFSDKITEADICLLLEREKNKKT